MKRARRRAALRRLRRGGIVLLVVGAIAGIVFFVNAQRSKGIQEADAAAQRLGCAEIAEKPNLLDSVPGEQQHVPPEDYEEKPATSGPHNAQPLPGEPKVYTDPLDHTLETQLVHNLEHGYVVIYYQSEGPNALAQNVVDRLAGLAREENKVIMGPYYSMPSGASLAFVAWQRLQTCPTVEDAGAILDVARGFIERFRGGAGLAPEPNAA